MTPLFWWVVASTVISFGGILVAVWYSKRLYDKGMTAGDKRTLTIIEAIRTVAEGDGSEPETAAWDREKFLADNGPLLDAVSDHILARMKLSDTNTANALAPKSSEAKGLIEMALKAKEDPSGFAKTLFDGQPWG